MQYIYISDNDGYFWVRDFDAGSMVKGRSLTSWKKICIPFYVTMCPCTIA